MSTVIAKPVFKPQINFKVEELLQEERATIVHCMYNELFGAIRIWPTTFLVQPNGNRKKLLQAFGISEYPDWMYVSYGHVFTLVFEGLDKGCELFDLYEDIPEPGGFQMLNIKRNNSDVYFLEIY